MLLKGAGHITKSDDYIDIKKETSDFSLGNSLPSSKELASLKNLVLPRESAPINVPPPKVYSPYYDVTYREYLSSPETVLEQKPVGEELEASSVQEKSVSRKVPRKIK